MRSAFIFLTIFLVNACGGGSNNNPSDANIIGTWVVPCTAEEFAFVVRTLVVNAELWSSTTEGFSDANCQNSSIVSPSGGTYVIGAYVTSSEGVNVRDITFNMLEADGSIRYSDEGVYHIENDVLYFGTYDETTGVPALDFDRAWEKQ